MFYPWDFDAHLAMQPLKAAAQLLAGFAEWPDLYDRKVLQSNTVPVAATNYWDDMYVEGAFAEDTARLIQVCKVWVTNE